MREFKSTSLADQIFEKLENDIIVGVYPRGEILTELKLVEQLGVSRTPIREAIRKLELEGLVTMIPRRGAEVAQITEKSMSDVLEVRRAMDALCTELACERISEEDIETLRLACDKFAAAVKTKDVRKSAQADVEFHDIILKATGNVRLVQLINNLSEQMYRYRFEYLKDSSRYDNLIEEHRVIYDGIKRRDKVAASEAAKLHIDNQKKAIIQQIRLDKASRK